MNRRHDNTPRSVRGASCLLRWKRARASPSLEGHVEARRRAERGSYRSASSRWGRPRPRSRGQTKPSTGQCLNLVKSGQCPPATRGRLYGRHIGPQVLKSSPRRPGRPRQVTPCHSMQGRMNFLFLPNVKSPNPMGLSKLTCAVKPSGARL